MGFNGRWAQVSRNLLRAAHVRQGFFRSDPTFGSFPVPFGRVGLLSPRAILGRLRPLPGLRLESTRAHFRKGLPRLVSWDRAGSFVASRRPSGSISGRSPRHCRSGHQAR